MGIGTSIVLIVLGAILTFAVATEEAFGVDLPVVGIILMVAGVVGLILTLTIFGPRRRTTVVDDRPREREVVRDRDTY
ncbi:MAG: hypothetical protein H0W51_11020 [Euzebyales bacterium]|jgi:uncharacterized membrane protein|nr:hypothetical protein [Euzebyales bacterium]MDQ3708272.1 DUF6458 family protein [Actinomycetota bacterium]